MKFRIPKLDHNKIYELEGQKYVINSYSMWPNTPKGKCYINCELLGKPDVCNECFTSDFWEKHISTITEWIEQECQFDYYTKIIDMHSKATEIITTVWWYPFTNVVWYNNSILDANAELANHKLGFTSNT